MKRLSVYLALAFLLFMSIGFYPRLPRFDCAPATELMKHNLRNGRTFVGSMITRKLEVMQIYLNPDSREWVIIAIDTEKKDRGCIVMRGTNWLRPGEWSI
jgi:hypothetical protein